MGRDTYLQQELSIGHRSLHRWRGNIIRTLFARGARGCCLLSEALTHLQQA
jgi:hypothetical protein